MRKSRKKRKDTKETNETREKEKEKKNTNEKKKTTETNQTNQTTETKWTTEMNEAMKTKKTKETMQWRQSEKKETKQTVKLTTKLKLSNCLATKYQPFRNQIATIQLASNNHLAISKGNCAVADLRHGGKDTISPSTLIVPATKSFLGIYALHIPPKVL